MAIIGFAVGALFVILLRAAQNLTPLWDTGVVIVLSSFTTAIFFMWGVGAFNPKLSEHGDGSEPPPLDEVLNQQPPLTILGFSTWQLAFWLILIVAVLAAGAVLGPTLRTVTDPNASVSAVGLVPVELFGQEVMVSQIFIFIGFAAVMLISLAITAWVIGLAVFGAARGVKSVEVAPAGKGRAKALPAQEAPAALPASTSADMAATPAQQPNRILAIIRFVVIFAVLVFVLYNLFYAVLLGLVLGYNQTTVIVSLIHAVAITVLIMRPSWIGRPLGRGARWLAGKMRGDDYRDPTRKMSKDAR
jgi:hypothetical protein